MNEVWNELRHRLGGCQLRIYQRRHNHLRLAGRLPPTIQHPVVLKVRVFCFCQVCRWELSVGRRTEIGSITKFQTPPRPVQHCSTASQD